MPELSKRERNKLANRNAILQAGREVFSTIGYDAATVRDIVRASGLSPGTFYNYFPDKDAVFAVLLGELLGELRPRLRDVRGSAKTGEEFIKDAFAAVVEVLLGDPDNFALIQKSTNALRQRLFDGPELAGILEELRADFATAQEAGLLPPFPTDLMASAMLGATLEVCVLGTRSDASPKALGEFLGNLFYRSLGG
jgi:AcrR family transcriptional regulator